MFDALFEKLLCQVPGAPSVPALDPQISLIERVLTPEIMGILVPIVGIVTFGAVWITKMVIRHRERMAMLELGINPDEKPAEVSARHAETIIEPPR